MTDGDRLRSEAARAGVPADVVRALKRAAALLDAEDQRAREARQEDITATMRVPSEGRR